MKYISIKILLPVVIVVLAAVGGLYYFSHKSSGGFLDPNAMTREKAAEIILAYLTQHPEYGSVMMTGSLQNTGSGIECPNGMILGDTKASQQLEKEGYLTEVYAHGVHTYTPTAQAQPYVLTANTSTNGINNSNILFAKLISVEVTGLTDLQKGFVQANFTGTNQITPFGAAVCFRLPQLTWRILNFLTMVGGFINKLAIYKKRKAALAERIFDNP